MARKTDKARLLAPVKVKVAAVFEITINRGDVECLANDRRPGGNLNLGEAINRFAVENVRDFARDLEADEPLEWIKVLHAGVVT